MPTESPYVQGAYVKIECMLRPRTTDKKVACIVTLRKKAGAGLAQNVAQTILLLDECATEQFVAAHVSSALRELALRIN